MVMFWTDVEPLAAQTFWSDRSPMPVAVASLRHQRGAVAMSDNGLPLPVSRFTTVDLSAALPVRAGVQPKDVRNPRREELPVQLEILRPEASVPTAPKAARAEPTIT